jgi:C1A family cysteine protease
MASKKPSKKASKSPTRILNCLPSPAQEDDWSMTTAVNASVLRAAGSIPTAKDLRATWWPIGDQGSTGSCVGWAATDSVIRWHMVKQGRMTQRQLLSVRYVWMAAKETDEFSSRPTSFIEADGTSLKAALDVARKYGVVLEEDLPFASGQLFPGETDAFYARAAARKVASYFNLQRDPRVWKRWIAENGPILTRLTVDDTWMNAKNTQGKLLRYDAASADGGHAVALVGYTADSFIVRNSWGTTLWGDKGFGYASLEYASEAFTEAYGITI